MAFYLGKKALTNTSGRAAALLFLLACADVRPVAAEVIRSDVALSGRRICWFSGLDSEQYNRDHSYIYTYTTRLWDQTHQYVIRGVWAMALDGSVTLKMDGGGIWVRKYEVSGDRVGELSGSLDGGRDGYFC